MMKELSKKIYFNERSKKVSTLMHFSGCFASPAHESTPTGAPSHIDEFSRAITRP